MKFFQLNYKGSCAIEIKVARKGSKTIPKSALADHQKLALWAASSTRGMVHKISDEARRQQPFDAFKLVNVPAYVVACFGNTCLAIRVENWEGANVDSTCAFKFQVL